MTPGAEAGQLGPAEQLGQLRAAEEAAKHAGARRGAPTVNHCRKQCWQKKNREFALAVCENGESYV